MQAAFMMGRYLVASKWAIFITMAARVVHGVRLHSAQAFMAVSTASSISLRPTLW